MEEEEEELDCSGIQICAVERLCSLSLRGNKSFAEQFPVVSDGVKIRNKHELLNDDNNKRESRGV